MKKRHVKSPAERAREDYALHPERHKKAFKKYYQKHKDRIDAMTQKFISENKARWNDCRRRRRLLRKEERLTESILQIALELKEEDVATPLVGRLFKLGLDLKKTREDLSAYADWADGRTLEERRKRGR